MIEIETQSYAGSGQIYEGIGERYGGLWCLPFTFHFLGVRAEHLRQLGHTFVWLPRSRERYLGRRMPWIAADFDMRQRQRKSGASKEIFLPMAAAVIRITAINIPFD